MKRVFYMIVAALFSCSCTDNVSKVFDDYFICIKDEYGSETSRIEETANDLTMSYYVTLVAPVLEKDITVSYSITCGDGLVEGEDFVVVKKSRTLTISRGVQQMPIRIVYNKKKIDPNKDNTITIRLTGVDREGITLGYPGPKASYCTHTITKVEEQ